MDNKEKPAVVSGGLSAGRGTFSQKDTNGTGNHQVASAPPTGVVARFAQSLSGGDARPPRPVADAPRFDKMPSELVERVQWVMWRYEWKPQISKWTKVPYQLDGRRASHSDPKTWCSFAAARATYARGSFAGVGFVFTAADPFVFIDFDHVLLPDGSLEPKCERYIDIAHSFAERSVSHTGFHILGRGVLPQRPDKEPGVTGRKRAPVELYDRVRFGVMTGYLIAPLPLADIQPLINEIIATYWPEESSRPSAPAAASEPEIDSVTDDALIEAILSSPLAVLFQKLLSEYAGGPTDDLPRHGPVTLDHSASGYDNWFGRICCRYGATVDQAIRIWQGSTLYSRIEPKDQRRKSDYLAKRLGRLRQKGTGANAGPLPTLVRLTDVEETELTWLVLGRIPRGAVTMLCGDGEIGKTLTTQDLVARITTGRGYDHVKLTVPMGNVIYVGDEDTISSVAKPRLRAAGVDPDRVFFLKGDVVFPDHIELLRDLALEKQALLIVIEPLDSFIKNAEKIAHVNSAMRTQIHKPLTWLAEQTQAAVIFITHPNKMSSEKKARYRASGSAANVNAPRAAYYYDFHPDDCDKPEAMRRRVIAKLKFNLGPSPASWVYKIVPKKISGPNPDQATIHWLSESCDLTADALVAAGSQTESKDSKLTAAKSFVHEKLSPGPMPLYEFHQLAIKAGIADATLKRARQDLKILYDRSTHMVRLPEEEM
jgi:hypothetical protein